MLDKIIDDIEQKEYAIFKNKIHEEDLINSEIHIESGHHKFQKLNYIDSDICENNIFDITSKDKELPANITGKFKTYMDYRKITNKGTKQYELQQSATTDEHGFRRYDDLYMIALGTYFSPVSGLEFEIEFCNGKIINCITGDVKDNKHTDSTNRYNEMNGNILEFIVDTQKINELSRIMGDMSYSDMEGEIIRITQINIQEENHDGHQ